MQYYDIIGDVHGHATKLENLLVKMDYKLVNDTYQHDTRKVIFVGDYIDRGGEEAKTIHIVRNMVEAGNALAIMGNHEFNAICYATPHPDSAGEFLREHSAKNQRQHQAFLDEFPFGSDEHKDAIAWFKTLPIYLDLEHIRIVHACWHQDSIDKLDTIINTDKTLPEEMYISASNEDNLHYQYIENVVKALEQKLPSGVIFKDKDDNPRSAIRIKWWSTEEPTYKNLALTVPEKSMADIPDEIIADVYFYNGDKPVFFGHYWMEGKPTIQSDKVACTDYSAGKGGNLIAYRWNGEVGLLTECFLNV